MAVSLLRTSWASATFWSRNASIERAIALSTMLAMVTTMSLNSCNWCSYVARVDIGSLLGCTRRHRRRAENPSGVYDILAKPTADVCLGPGILRVREHLCGHARSE